ncbi:GTP-binding protein At2g22870-like [Syzygium oleosum]|uniref:GTP-binding protein At2g22870-like n=1 Tax=Syzygium oleosum TaxID=219896 RepID=UPI0024BB4024|nr:GTP-binding protein At2g22870-like [Syzygium oleosum]
MIKLLIKLKQASLLIKQSLSLCFFASSSLFLRFLGFPFRQSKSSPSDNGLTLQNHLFTLHLTSLLQPSLQPSPNALLFSLSLKTPPLLQPTHHGPCFHGFAFKTASPTASDSARIVRKVFLFLPKVDPAEGHAQIKEVKFVKSSGRAKDCPEMGGPSLQLWVRLMGASLGISMLWFRGRRKLQLNPRNQARELINHFLVNKSWYVVDLLGYG